MTLTWADVPTPPAGRVERFGGRWRLVAAGLSNVWRYGDLDLDAASGRLLLRGPNGTGKTTALEVLWPYLLDLNAALLGAGKARNTHLSQLMREAADGRRRIGFVWLTFAGPGDTGPVTYGVRLNYSKGSTPEVKVAPFTVPGRVLHDVALWGTGRASFSPEQFDAHLAAHGGTVFHSNDDYVRDLAARVFDTDPAGLVELARRIREVRNPALLGVVSPQAAAEALKVALPGVAEDTIDATGEALAESDATRAAFEADRTAAETLSGFARVWIGHAADVAATYRQRAVDAVNQARRHANDVRRLDGETEQARSEADTAKRALASLQGQQQSTGSRLRALERSDEYRDAGRLTELAAAAQSLDATAQAKFDALTGAATQAARLTDADAQAAEYLTGDIADVLEPVARDVTVPAATSLFHTAKAARPALHVGDTTVDAGVALSAAFDDAAFDSTVATLTGRADGLAGEANRARLYLQAHEAVAADETEATKARAEAERLARTAEEAARMEKAKAAVAAVEVAALAELLAGYAADIDDDCGWDPDTLADIDWTDPPAALADADELASTTSSWAHGQAAAANARAASLTQQANGQRVEAEALRAEATRLRDHDVLLPLPRPDWAGESDDDTAAFGAAVDWVDGVDSTTQDTVEAVLAAAGVLGATLHAGGARTAAWAVDATGPVTADNLAALLRPDTDHPLADVAARVLERVTLAPTALDSDRPGLIIGLDGTFRAGILAAAVPDARDRARRRPAAHIGARRRRDAALAHAARLGAQAAELNTTAAALDEQGAQETAEAERVVDLAGRFPNREALRSAESARAAAAAAAEAADQAAAAAETHADELTAVATEHRRRWTTDVIDAGLPADAAKLSDIVTHAAAKAQALRSAANSLTNRFRRRALDLVATIADHDPSSEVDRLHADAVAAHDEARDARAIYDELHEQIGRSADEVLERHRQLKATLAGLGPKVTAADARDREAGQGLASLTARLDGARTLLAESEPAASRTVAELRALLALPGVTDAVLAGDEPDPDDRRFLAQLGTALEAAPRSARRTLRERADEVRARLAGVWSVDPGVDHPELDTYSLTHGTTSHTPVAAADHAQLLATKAEEALRAADDAALENFVIGRLPAAIAEAWTALHDWVRDVNRKMGSATASSGVGVTVHVSVRDDLPPVARAVYELVCKSGAALRDNDARSEAGRAIHQLINAADGDDMVARVRTAVNVRDWVDVNYRVVRPGEEPRTWNSRTGLSGGERRLVVLAPMLAAVAAAYDRFGDRTGRIVALDEIPSEVDETGREGLARYIAELDLDLIATSHHWDGAPGAWDGIDAHDLEAAPDGTVVAFPMLVRAAAPLPDDPMLS